MTGYDDDPGDGPSRVDQLRNALLDSAGLSAIAPPQPLIDGVLYLDSLAWLHGKPGNAKSFVALDWAACISLGLPWQGLPVTPGPVLYVIAEGVAGLPQRVRAWEDHARTVVGIRFLPVAVQLMSPLDVNAVIILASEIKPVFIVVDTQARATMGADENSSKDMGQLVSAVDRIRYASRACVLLVHHEPRNGESMRGSTALEGAATTIVRVTKDGSHLRLDNTKQKDAPPFEALKLRLVPHADSAVIQSHGMIIIDGEMTAGETKLIETMRETVGPDGMSPSTLAEIAQDAKMSRATFFRALKSLVRRGEVVNVGSEKRKRYALAPGTDQSQSHGGLTEVSSPVESQVSRSHHPFRGETSETNSETDADDGYEPPC